MTASRALSNRPGVSIAVRDEILRLAGELGYTVNRAARKLSGGRSHIIGVVTVQMQNPFTGEVLGGAVRAARAAGYEVLAYSLLGYDEGLPGNLTQVLGQIADGVIALLPFSHDYLGALAAMRVPVVTVEDCAERLPYPSITSDNYGGACEAVRHLTGLGHRRIGFITGHEKLNSALDRRRAYLDQLAEQGIPHDPALIARGDYTQRGGYEAARQLLSLPQPPTAIFAANDDTALGVLTAAQERGLRVPRDLSLVGFDDAPSASQIRPALTTVRQPMQQLGRSAVNMLLATLAGIEAPSAVVSFTTELVVRESTAPPRARSSRTPPAGTRARRRRTDPQSAAG